MLLFDWPLIDKNMFCRGMTPLFRLAKSGYLIPTISAKSYVLDAKQTRGIVLVYKLIYSTCIYEMHGTENIQS